MNGRPFKDEDLKQDVTASFASLLEDDGEYEEQEEEETDVDASLLVRTVALSSLP